MDNKFVKKEKIFKTKEALDLFPDNINVTFELNHIDNVEVDIIIPSHGNYQLTNLTVQNYLLLEKKTKFNIIVVDSSGDVNKFKKVKTSDNVSKILVNKQVDEIHRKTGKPSPWGMMFSTSVAYQFTTAPFIYVSHNDMIATKENFITFIKSKLSDNIRLASFTQSHIIPPVGCTIFKRELLDEPDLDWGMYPRNKYIEKNDYLQYIASLRNKYLMDGIETKGLNWLYDRINWLDGGEDYVYSEITKGNKLYICASVGGNDNYWKHPFDYYDLPRPEIEGLVKTQNCPFIYAPLNISKEIFETKYEFVLNASKSLFFEGERTQRKYWRYCFDDDGDLMFIHHGRGTTRSAVNRWIKFVKKFNKNIS